MAGTSDLVGLVPGFEFLQSLMKNAGAAIPGVPGMSQWIAPTLDPAELDKRIQELKTVQFWLEQNARLLATTIQALEVQRMTLATLQTMNLPLADLRDALTIKPAAAAPAPAAEPEPPPPAEAAAKPATAPASPAVDPMQWWTALTQQFTQLATQAVKDSAAAAATAVTAEMPAAAKAVAAKTARKPAPKSAPAPASRATAARPRSR